MATALPLIKNFDPQHGQLIQVSPLIRRMVAPNMGPFTFMGTGVYIIGAPGSGLAVIDPGPALPEHVDKLVEALAGETISHILITHTHMDHSPAAAPLKAATGAKTYGYGAHNVSEGPAVEEGGDAQFVPDVSLGDGALITGDGWTMQAIYTPGHISNHLCFALQEENCVFTGDHVMGWSTSVISPPDGNMADYMASLDKMLARPEELYYPTHGAPVPQGKDLVRAFIAHRQDRERQIATQLATGPQTIAEMVPVMYADVDPRLHPAAARSVLAHMIHMVENGEVTCDGTPAADSRYTLKD